MGRIAATVIITATLACCAAKSQIAAVQNVWILPISAKDTEQVCVITMDYPGRRCTTVADIRSYLRSVKAN